MGPLGELLVSPLNGGRVRGPTPKPLGYCSWGEEACLRSSDLPGTQPGPGVTRLPLHPFFPLPEITRGDTTDRFCFLLGFIFLIFSNGAKESQHDLPPKVIVKVRQNECGRLLLCPRTSSQRGCARPFVCVCVCVCACAHTHAHNSCNPGADRISRAGKRLRSVRAPVCSSLRLCDVGMTGPQV